jgi:hypothetical protein
MTAFDARPLTEPVDRSAVREFAQRLRRSSAASVGMTFAAVGVLVGVVGVFVAVGASILASVIAAIATSQQSVGVIGVVVSLVPLLMMIGVAVAIGVGVWRIFGGVNHRRYRLDRFARANGMTYHPGVGNPGLPGMVFGIGNSRASSDLIRGERPRFVEFGNYSYSTGSGKNRTTHRWGYVAVRLDVPLPHIVLDAVGNNSFFGSNLPATFDADQRLSLEGDFDRFFTLYCPAGYERDALYLFTPDIMARFIDNAAALDVEIVDDWLFLYAKRDMTPLDPAVWAWQFAVVAALLDKLAQWARWRDDRLAAASTVPVSTEPAPFAAPAPMLRPPPGVAAPGRRLQRRLSWFSIIAAVAIVGVWILQFLLRALS